MDYQIVAVKLIKLIVLVVVILGILRTMLSVYRTCGNKYYRTAKIRYFLAAAVMSNLLVMFFFVFSRYLLKFAV